eukprot:3757987-Prymnesium_polylepis.2
MAHACVSCGLELVAFPTNSSCAKHQRRKPPALGWIDNRPRTGGTGPTPFCSLKCNKACCMGADTGR